jgi:hypothetical protein
LLSPFFELLTSPNEARWNQKGLNEVYDSICTTITPLVLEKYRIEASPLGRFTGVVYELTIVEDPGDVASGSAFAQKSGQCLNLTFGE